MHIEQGTQLENAGLRVGVVTGIVAIWQWRIAIEGMQDHAGGTTMAERRDAGLAAVRLLAMIDQEFPQICGERSTWTTGRIAVEPVRRASSPARRTSCSSSATSTWRCWSGWSGPPRLVQESNRRERCTATLRRSASRCRRPATRHHGGAGAAAESLRPAAGSACRAAPCMTPVHGPRDAGGDPLHPSIGGISHHWAEDTKEEDLVLRCRILADAAERFLRG